MKKNSLSKLKKSLGQNFLQNTVLAYQITEHLKDTDNSIILEIGCGNGALSKYIKDKNYIEYHIIELDMRWAKFVSEEYIKNNKKIVMYNENILNHNFNTTHQYNIIGNIPYNITYEILQKIFNYYECINSAVIMMQEEVALKIAKKSGSSYGPISVISQLLFDISLHEKISPTEFIPQPKVFSRIISFKKKQNTIINFLLFQSFKKFLSILFSYPRKKIKHQGLPLKYQEVFTQEILEKRSQELSPESLYNLFLLTI